MSITRHSPEKRQITLERREVRSDDFRDERGRSPEDRRPDFSNKPNDVLQQSRIQYDLEKKELPMKAQPVKSIEESKRRRSRSSSSGRSRSEDSRSSRSSSDSDDDSAEEQKKEKRVEVWLYLAHTHTHMMHVCTL